MQLSAPIVSLVENQELIWEARSPVPGMQRATFVDSKKSTIITLTSLTAKSSRVGRTDHESNVESHKQTVVPQNV